VNKISDITRQDIQDIIKDGFVEVFDEPVYDGETGEYVTESKVYMPFYGRLDEIGFFSRLYDLKSLPSHDSRYRDALGDISCHLRWGDYEEGWFFQDRRFKLLQGDGDEPLLSFICEMLHPAVRIEKSPWKSYLEKFNELLHADGYELYAAQHISGRDIYKARAYTQSETPVLPDNLFSERYKELISFGNGDAIDNISGNVGYNAKKHLCKVMFEFAEPMRIQRSRYDNWTDNTDALKEAISHLNEYMEIPVIDLSSAMFSPCPVEELLASYFTPFIFDVIEYQFNELSTREKAPFQAAINDSLRKDNLSFRLSDSGLIELQADHEVLSPEIIANVDLVAEPGIRDLIKEAIEKHMQPTVQAHRDAVEKIWDALERLKTYYTTMDKRASASKIVADMADGDQNYTALFNAEFKALTDIGNDYRIRHHETNKIDISDPRYYDYFFNRCLSLIALAIQYLQ
jgi:hypothetical protein